MEALPGTRLAPADEYTHRPDDDPSFNESMYFNLYDPAARLGGFFRVGNRPNEGYAEMTVCLYLPEGQVAFMFARPEIASNESFDAGGLRFEVLEPLERLRVSYDGPLAVLEDPLAMRDPKRAFSGASGAPGSVEIEFRGVSPVLGGEAEGPFAETDLLASFARAHYEQHMAGTGQIAVGERAWEVEGFGLRDHSWGPRSWHAPLWYRWLTCNAGEDDGFMVSVIATDDGRIRRTGVLLRDGRYTPLVEPRIETAWAGEHADHTALRVTAKAGERELGIEGRVLSLIPLRHRREGRLTRIGEGLTEYRFDGKVGYGLAEYLDRVVDGVPAGAAA